MVDLFERQAQLVLLRRLPRPRRAPRPAAHPAPPLRRPRPRPSSPLLPSPLLPHRIHDSALPLDPRPRLPRSLTRLALAVRTPPCLPVHSRRPSACCLASLPEVDLEVDLLGEIALEVTHRRPTAVTQGPGGRRAPQRCARTLTRRVGSGAALVRTRVLGLPRRPRRAALAPLAPRLLPMRRIPPVGVLRRGVVPRMDEGRRRPCRLARRVGDRCLGREERLGERVRVRARTRVRVGA